MIPLPDDLGPLPANAIEWGEWTFDPERGVWSGVSRSPGGWIVWDESR